MGTQDKIQVPATLAAHQTWRNSKMEAGAINGKSTAYYGLFLIHSLICYCNPFLG